MLKKYLVLFVFLFSIYVIHTIVTWQGLYGDANGFYSYTQSIFFDHSLNFNNVYNFLEKFQGPKGEFSRLFWDRAFNPYPIGTGLIWIPSVAAISFFFHDRFSTLIELGPGITGIICMLAGMFFLERYLENYFSRKIATISVFFFFFTSNMFYYSSFEPALSHQPVFFIVSYLLYKTYKFKQTEANYILVGALSGFLFTTRVADVVLLIPIFMQVLAQKPKIKHIIFTIVTGLIFTLPLLWSYQVMLGSPFKMPYLLGGNKVLSFSPVSVFNFFFTAKRGLFTWTPVYLIALIGLIKSKKYSYLIAVTLITLISSFWASISVAFGQRFVFSAIPYFTFGLAFILKKLKPKITVIMFSVLVTWNILTLFQFYYNKSEVIKNDNLTLTTFIEGQFTSPVRAINILRDKGLNYLIYKKILY